MFTDEEALPWVKNKIQTCTDLKIENNRDLYGAMHVLCSDRHGMETYVKAYKCDDKQGVIANLRRGLADAIYMLEELRACTTSLRQVAKKADEALKAVVKCDDCGGAGGLWDARCTTCNGAGYFKK
jgi:hypothetical protein